MDHCPVLDIYPVAYADGIYITTDDSIEPEAAIIAAYYITNYDCCFREVAVFTESRSKTTHRFN